MATTRSQLTSALTQFYNQPIARVSFELLLSLGAVIFFAVFAIRPTLLTMSDLIKEIEDKRALEKQLSQKVAALATAQSEYLNLQEDLPVLDQALPNSPQLLNTVKIIEKLASERGLIVASMAIPEIPAEKTSENIDVSKFKRINVPLTVSVMGDYPTIRQFVEDLRQVRRSLVVESVTFATSEERGKKKLKAIVSVGMPYIGIETATKKDTRKTPTTP